MDNIGPSAQTPSPLPGRRVHASVYIFVALAVLVAGLGLWWFWDDVVSLLSSGTDDEIVAAFNQGNFDDALNQIEDILAKNPNDIDALYFKAQILAQKGSLTFNEDSYGSQAVATADQILTQDPNNTRALYVKGYALEIQNQFDEAIVLYEKAISLEPDNALYLNQLGHAYDLSGDKESAKSYYEKAIEKDPELVSAQANLARVYWIEDSNTEEATELLLSVAEGSANNRSQSEALYALGMIEANKNNPWKALEYMESAVTADPSYPHAHIGKGWAVFLIFIDDPNSNARTEDSELSLEKAFGEVEQAIELHEYQTFAYLTLARMYLHFPELVSYSLENYEKALSVMDRDITLMGHAREGLRKEIQDELKKAQETIKNAPKEISFGEVTQKHVSFFKELIQKISLVNEAYAWWEGDCWVPERVSETDTCYTFRSFNAWIERLRDGGHRTEITGYGQAYCYNGSSIVCSNCMDLSLSSNPDRINHNEYTTLSWRIRGRADSCWAETRDASGNTILVPNWEGPIDHTVERGSKVVGPLSGGVSGTRYEFRLVCQNRYETLPTSDRVDVGPMPPSVCGDGNREGPEQDPGRCEDGNLIDGDGCSSMCYVERCEAGENLVQNGSFELPVIGTGWIHIDSPNIQFKWDVRRRDDRTRTNRFELLRGWNGYASGDGAQYTELDVDRSVSIFQTVPTVVGETYRVSYKFSPRPGEGANDNSLEVSLNGLAKDTISQDGRSLADTQWVDRSFEFIASSPSSRVQFTDLGESDGKGTFLDAVSVECVPLPPPQSCNENNVKDLQTEECDGSDLDGATCPLGFTGTPSCSNCRLIYSGYCSPPDEESEEPPPGGGGVRTQCNDNRDNEAERDGFVDEVDPACWGPSGGKYSSVCPTLSASELADPANRYNPTSRTGCYNPNTNNENNCGNGICETWTGESVLRCSADCAFEHYIEY